MARRPWQSGWIFLGLIAWSGCGKTSAPSVSDVVTAPSTPKPAATPPVSRPKLSPTFQVLPAKVELKPGDAGFQLVVTHDRPAATSRDGSDARLEWRVEPSGVVAVDANGYVRPIGPGTASIKAIGSTGERAVSVVVGDETQRPWDFGQDIVPILTHAGCNTGSCHGRADGQNGFHLSLAGYDPEGDHRAITHDSGGRRISGVHPETSLLLSKALGIVPHGGGPRLRTDSIDYQTLLAWLKAGAPESRGKTHGALEAVVIQPADSRLDEPGPRQLRVLARYADGHERDVTRLATYKVNDDATLSITPEGKATLLRRGEADLIVRYQSQVVSTRLSTIINPDLDFDYTKLKRRNEIDEELFKRLEALRVPPSPPASDAAFLRRVSLDLTGEQPLPEQVRQFLADTNPDKRVKLVDRLIGTREFVLFWKIKLGDLLQITKTRFQNGASYYHAWVEEQLEKNTPWDSAVRTLLTSLGNPMAVDGGAVNYALDGPDAKASAEQTAQRFMALRLRCAQCHDHPFDVWTQDDYFGLAAFFAKVQRGVNAGGMSGRTEIKLNPKGEVEHLRTKKPAEPRLLGSTVVKIGEKDDPRKVLADWMTAPENPYFARATANWVWAQFFGKGLADPPDDLSRSNPPVHPELLDALAKHFVAHKFDLRDLIRTVVTSEAYGLSSGTVAGNEKDTRLFSHQIPRPLTPHQMADALAQATDVPNKFPDQPSSSTIRRAIEIYDPSTASPILDTFGRCGRTIACSSVATPPLSLRQSLLLIGGDVIQSKVTSLNGYLSNMLELNPEPDEVIDNLYMRVLCRAPTAEELSRWSAELKQATSLRDASEDLFWALLNSREFSFNH